MQQNNVGERLRFIKDRLELTLNSISSETDIPRSTLFDMLDGRRTTFYEIFDYLAFYFNCKWQARFADHARRGFGWPSFKGNEVESITYKWLTLGYDDAEEMKEKEMRELKEFFYTQNLKGEK